MTKQIKRYQKPIQIGELLRLYQVIDEKGNLDTDLLMAYLSAEEQHQTRINHESTSHRSDQ